MPPNINIPKTPSNAPNLNTSTGVESRSESFRKSIQASGSIRTTAQTVINTREDLVKMLQQNGLKLLTKMAIYKQTNDFIQSSVIVYPDHKDHQELLAEFIERYPQIKPFVLKINDNLKNR